ncbi:MAG: MFS transporter [Ectothiorhodospiraceae bacterium]|nr:MFS transporter [Ectothiorhodospiraceae bacterium]
MSQRAEFLFLNLGHLYDHLLMLVFATVAALALSQEWGMTYAELVPYATPGFVAFGVCALLAGWIADKWSREGMMLVFFVGIGASAALTGLADTPLQIGAGLLAVGVFAAIYHPVGIALVVQGRTHTGVPLAINGIFGNLGVAIAALLTGALIDQVGWRAAFVVPGLVSVATGIVYGVMLHRTRAARAEARRVGAKAGGGASLTLDRSTMIRVVAIIITSTAIGGLVFQSTTFALPKVFEERLGDLAVSATMIGWYGFLVFAVAAVGQVIVGYLIDRYSVRVVFVVVAALQAILFFTMIGLTGWNALLVSVGFMLAVFGQIPINDVLVGRISKSEWRSRMFALRYIVTFSVMASSVPLIGWIHGHWGFDTLFPLLALAALAILVCVAMLPRALTPVPVRA